MHVRSISPASGADYSEGNRRINTERRTSRAAETHAAGLPVWKEKEAAGKEGCNHPGGHPVVLRVKKSTQPYVMLASDANARGRPNRHGPGRPHLPLLGGIVGQYAMPDQRITVWTQRFKDGETLVLQWIDPLGSPLSRALRRPVSPGADAPGLLDDAHAIDNRSPPPPRRSRSSQWVA
jgi:hypothetical protein